MLIVLIGQFLYRFGELTGASIQVSLVVAYLTAAVVRLSSSPRKTSPH